MATWRVNNSTVLGNFVCAQWVPNTVYALGDRVVCRVAYATVARRAYVYECTTPGTSHAATEPTWPASGTVADNDIVWTTRNPNDGNWNNASCILHYVLNHAAVVNGEFVYIHYTHNEAVSIASYTIGTVSVLSRIVSVDKATDALTVGAYVGTTNNSDLIFVYSGYSYGVTYCSTLQHLKFGNFRGIWILESNGSDVLELQAASKYLYSAVTPIKLVILNGNIKFGQASNYLYLSSYVGFDFRWKKGTLVASNGCTKLIAGSTTYRDRNALIEDVDLSQVGNVNPSSLFDAAEVTSSQLNKILFSRCKLPSAAGFTPTTGSWIDSSCGNAKFHHCSASNITYDFLESQYEGTVQDETTIVRDGGASDGTTPQSWKMISSANTVDNINPLISPPIQSWTESTTSKTFTVECIVNSATNLQNDEVWMEFEYPVDNTSGLGGFARDKCAILGTPADKPASTVTWNGTGGMANPNKFKCAVTVTPGKKGPITARICLAKASTTIYVDPLITES